MARHPIPKRIEETGVPPERMIVPGRSPLAGLILSLRPSQWTKNLFLFAGLIFGQRLLDRSAVITSIAAFAVFCALSGVVYLINDVADRKADRQHPLKRNGGYPCRAVARRRLLAPLRVRNCCRGVCGPALDLLRAPEAHCHPGCADDRDRLCA